MQFLCHEPCIASFQEGRGLTVLIECADLLSCSVEQKLIREEEHMQVHVTFYGALRVVAGKQIIDVSFSEPTITIERLLDALMAKRPRIQPYLLNEAGKALHPDMRILLNGTHSTTTITLATQLHDNDRITFVIPLVNPLTRPSLEQ